MPAPDGRGQRVFPGTPHFPFFLAYAAAYLKAHGIDVSILDAVANEEYSYSTFIKKVEKEHADIVVIECSTPTIDIDLWVAKQISCFTEVALAGPHLAYKAAEVQKDHPYIKYLLKSEYILSTYEVVQNRRAGIYEGTVVEDLDSIPVPLRDFEGGEKYYDPSMPTRRPQLQIYGSKGCPFKCTFCMWPQTMYKGKVSLRKPEMIAREIREAVDLHNYKSIFFDDDTFNLGNERVSKICDELKKIGLPWTMMGRLDCSPARLYNKMVDCGCVGMRFGIETFNEEILTKVNKGLQRSDFLDTLKHLSNRYPKVMIHLTMMKDLPGQSEEIHQNDMKILHELGYTTRNRYRNYQLSRCAPFPGTQMYAQLIAEKGKEKLDRYKLYDGGINTVMKEINQ